MGIIEWSVDDSKCQVKQEKCSDEHKRHEKQENVVGVHSLVVHHDVWPALESDALENGEQGPENIIEAGDVVVRVRYPLSTEIALLADLSTATDHFFIIVIYLHGAWLNVDAALAKHARK